jgi:subfamily B ATP-binding cassette protein HlyB/CyaB
MTPSSANAARAFRADSDSVLLARALMTDPRILIFDEATSALDYESGRVIQSNMQQIAKGRTVIMIAHLRSARATIDRGRIVEDGTHEELVRTGGRYASDIG